MRVTTSAYDAGKVICLLCEQDGVPRGSNPCLVPLRQFLPGCPQPGCWGTWMHANVQPGSQPGCNGMNNRVPNPEVLGLQPGSNLRRGIQISLSPGANPEVVVAPTRMWLAPGEEISVRAWQEDGLWVPDAPGHCQIQEIKSLGNLEVACSGGGVLSSKQPKHGSSQTSSSRRAKGDFVC